ncbi:hypothetical protein [Lichenifustis flavocetrariae]|uniref:Uncharacterized protein n=1 Tax=Lichenifustis flavocetrariae TaxID=2949735 RepID=A0AA41Z3I8_9HYPH|nr:hypothetical protein [Lichenifustis flavocetrariae]MCW6509685.1 hypothetical protein [Lichenifustis flavocetrariae]
MGEGQTTTAAAQPAVLTTDVPRLEDAEATRLAQELFGISGRVARLTSERDANFQVEAPDGRAFVLKLSNAAEDPAITNF